MPTTNKRSKIFSIFRLPFNIVVAAAVLVVLAACSAPQVKALATLFTQGHATLFNMQVNRICYPEQITVPYPIYSPCTCDMCLRVFVAQRLPERLCVAIALETNQRYRIDFWCYDANRDGRFLGIR